MDNHAKASTVIQVHTRKQEGPKDLTTPQFGEGEGENESPTKSQRRGNGKRDFAKDALNKVMGPSFKGQREEKEKKGFKHKVRRL